MQKTTPNRIFEHRQRRGLSQSQLAALCGTTTQQISKLENGQRQLSGRWIEALATGLDVPKAALLHGGAGTEPAECDIIVDSSERMILRFWRKLGREEQDRLMAMATSWALSTVNHNTHSRSAQTA